MAKTRKVYLKNPHFLMQEPTDVLEELLRAIQAELKRRGEAEEAKKGGCVVRFDLRENARKPLYAAVIRPDTGGKRSFVNTLTREGPKDGRQRLYGKVHLQDGDVLEVRISANSARKEERWVGACHDGRLYGTVVRIHAGERMPAPLYLYTKGQAPLERAVADLAEYDPETTFVYGG